MIKKNIYLLLILVVMLVSPIVNVKWVKVDDAVY